MNWILVCFLIVIILIFILFVPLFFQFRFYVNVVKNIGTISVTLFGFLVITSFQAELGKDAINILTKNNNKEKQIKYLDIQNLLSFKIVSQIFKRLNIYEMSLFFLAGKNKDAFTPVILGGIFLSFVHSLLAVLQTKKGNFDTYVGTTVDCDDDDIKLSGYLSLSITIFQIIVSVFLGVIYMKKIRSKVYGSKKQSN